MTYILARVISWLFYPVVVLILALRMARGALRPPPQPSYEVAESRFSNCSYAVVITWPSGDRDIFHFRKDRGWVDARDNFASRDDAQRCEVAVAEHLALKRITEGKAP